MSALDILLDTLSGPRRLRSALRQKTVVISRLLGALEGPTQLRATIPAAVFGGDIFNVISEQLRDALIVPPATASVMSRPHRKQVLPLSENPAAKHPKNPSPLANRLKPSTIPGETFAVSKKASFPNTERSSLEPQASGADPIPENLTQGHARRAHALETSAVSQAAVLQRQTIEAATSMAILEPAARLAPTESTLVNSLNRYWQHSRKANHNAGGNERVGIEQPKVLRSRTVPEVEQPGATAWPNSITPDALKNRVPSDRSALLNRTTDSAAARSLRSAPLKSSTDPDFNFHQANYHAPTHDDLGDRLAQILHEQALQHGIDVT